MRGGPIKPYSNPPGQRKSPLCPRIRTIKKKLSLSFLARGERKRKNLDGEITSNVNYRPSLHIPFYVSFAINGEKVTASSSPRGGYLSEERREPAAMFLHGPGGSPEGHHSHFRDSQCPVVHPIASAIRSVRVSLTTDIA